MLKKHLSSSELILNPDGSVYHLQLKPEDIASAIITVGDPDRVNRVSQYFDRIEVKKGGREFITHTGTLQGKRITVVSTGIGTDNIDIVINELDALVNIDLESRTIRARCMPICGKTFRMIFERFVPDTVAPNMLTLCSCICSMHAFYCTVLYSESASFLSPRNLPPNEIDNKDG